MAEPAVRLFMVRPRAAVIVAAVVASNSPEVRILPFVAVSVREFPLIVLVALRFCAAVADIAPFAVMASVQRTLP